SQQNLCLEADVESYESFHEPNA
ncbi:hypothetical protein D031_4430B, partial [Vibrio parahaemolyticus VP-48]